MTPGTAALSPAGCQEVAAAECVVAAPDGVQGHWTDGPTRISVTALKPEDLSPYPGVDVVISAYSMKSFDPVSGSLSVKEIARGKTGADGQYVWQGSAPGSPNKDYRFRVAVADGRPKTTDVLARTASATASANQAVSEAYVASIICLGSSDPLVCAVAEAQVQWASIYEQQLQALNYYTSGRPPQVAGIAADQAHANVPLNHPKLKEHWDTFSWWVGDMGIPPKDWPALIQRFEQTWGIFSKIPFPKYPGIEDMFTNCAKGVPIGQGRGAENYSIVNPRLYSDTWSAYFPRSSKQINKDMAFAYMVAAPSIFGCMLHKLKQKVKETERSLRSMAFLSLVVIFINLPLLLGAGVAGVAVLATEVYEVVTLLQQGKEAASQGITAALALALIASGQDVSFVTAVLGPVIESLLKDVDPAMAKAIVAIYPKVIQFAVSNLGASATSATQAGSTTLSTGAVSGIDLASIGTSVGTAAALAAVKMMSMFTKTYMVERIKNFQDAAVGAQTAGADLMAVATGEEVSETLKPFFNWFVDAIGFIDLIADAISQGLDQIADALGTGQAQGGGVTVVPDSGGGVAVAPTDASGTPTDERGTPLPGGVAPETPLVIPSATSEIGALAGIGGATAALLLITGAVRF